MSHGLTQVTRSEVLRSAQLGYNVFGENPAVGATYEQLWAYGGAYNFTMGSGAIKLASSSAADASAGTGARTVRVYGLVSGVLADELVTMNGQTAVSLSTAFTRVYMAKVETAGSGAANAGDIYCFTGNATAGVPSTSTEVYFKMLALGSRTHVAIFQVPTGYNGYVTNWWAAGGDANNSMRVQLMIRESGVQRALSGAMVFQNLVEPHPFDFPLRIPAGADVFMRAITLGGGTPEISGGFTMVLA